MKYLNHLRKKNKDITDTKIRCQRPKVSRKLETYLKIT
jgi:hypothetical protein